MLAITTKLKRIKCMRIIASLIVLPFRLPLMLFYILGQGAEKVDGMLAGMYSSFEMLIVRKFKMNEVAKKQHKKNPSKFDT